MGTTKQQSTENFIKDISKPTPHEDQIQFVESFESLISIPFQGKLNAICWKRALIGNFAEIVDLLASNENIRVLDYRELLELTLSEEGKLARKILLQDIQLLSAHGADPVLNLIRHYERDEANPFFPTDVYSFHVDHSTEPTDTFLCTYYGNSSEIVSNEDAIQKVLIPEIRDELKRLYGVSEAGLETYIKEHFYDLHYQAKADAQTLQLGLGNLWRLAVDYPGSPVMPCVHRAPLEKIDEPRLLLIC